MEIGSEKQQRDYARVTKWVKKYCHTKWMEKEHKFNSYVTCISDVNCMANVPLDAERGLIHKVYGCPEMLEYINNKMDAENAASSVGKK